METFAEYGFNKSHSTAYAMISYQTAYLKAHYPAEFMAALLTSEKDNRDKIIKHIAGCKEMGINVLPPDINQSLRDFSRLRRQQGSSPAEVSDARAETKAARCK